MDQSFNLRECRVILNQKDMTPYRNDTQNMEGIELVDVLVDNEMIELESNEEIGGEDETDEEGETLAAFILLTSCYLYKKRQPAKNKLKRKAKQRSVWVRKWAEKSCLWQYVMEITNSFTLMSVAMVAYQT